MWIRGQSRGWTLRSTGLYSIFSPGKCYSHIGWLLCDSESTPQTSLYRWIEFCVVMFLWLTAAPLPGLFKATFSVFTSWACWSFVYTTVMLVCPTEVLVLSLVKPKLDGGCTGGSIQSVNIVLSQMYFVFANGSAAFVLQLTAWVGSVPLPASQKMLPVIVANCAVQMNDFVKIIGIIFSWNRVLVFHPCDTQGGSCTAKCVLICWVWHLQAVTQQWYGSRFHQRSRLQHHSIFLTDNGVLARWNMQTGTTWTANKVLHLLPFAHNHFLLCLHASDFSISLNLF